jgi:hypothetical protein
MSGVFQARASPILVIGSHATLRPPERTPVLLSLDAEQIAALIKLGQDLLKR